MIDDKQQIARLGDAIAKDKRELIEIEGFLRAREMFDRDLALAFNWPKDMPLTKKQRLKGLTKGATKYAGSPGRGKGKEKVWKGRDGCEFVFAILTIRAREKCSVAAAILELKKADPKKWPEKPRTLARRFAEVKDYWGPWFDAKVRLEEWGQALWKRSSSEN